jgi:predicted nucleic acid-binding protein
VIVLDASAAVEWLLQTEPGKRVDVRVGNRNSLHAPHLFDVEITHALRRMVLSGLLPVPRAKEAVEDLESFRVSRYPHTDLLPRMWSLRNSITPYDAVYVALAEALDAPLITCDAKLASSAGHFAKIELISMLN